MLFYRIEHHTNLDCRGRVTGVRAGPYSGMSWDKPDEWWSSVNNHPDPVKEHLGLSQHEVCGFVSREKMLEWFYCPVVVAALKEAGFVLACYESCHVRSRTTSMQALMDTTQPMERLWSSESWEDPTPTVQAPIAVQVGEALHTGMESWHSEVFSEDLRASTHRAPHTSRHAPPQHRSTQHVPRDRHGRRMSAERGARTAVLEYLERWPMGLSTPCIPLTLA